MCAKSVQELEDVAPRVWYEWRMFKWAYSQLQDFEESTSGGDVVPWIPTTEACDPLDEHLLSYTAGTGGGEPFGSAVLECFLLHARVLAEFLSRDEGRRDDVLAVHFAETPWVPPEKREYLRENEGRIHKSLAHLSYKRIENERHKDWHHHEIYDEISEMWEHFWKALSAERREWFHPPTLD
jgi:hypothetical protein